MSRKNIFEVLNNNYDIAQEIDKITELFNSNMVSYFDGSYERCTTTIEIIFNSIILPNWKQRGTLLSLDEMKEKLNIPDYFEDESWWSINDAINLLEIYDNIAYLIHKKLNRDVYQLDNCFNLLIENIHILLDHLNYEHKIFENEEKVILIPKNPAATAVAEISDEETAMAILRYNHHTLKGDLETKRHLLNSIAREYEPLLNNPIEGYIDFFKKTNGLLNNLHIRHNNIESVDNKNLVIDIDDKTLEHWYDELYQLLLFCVLIDDNLNRKNDAGEFLKSSKGAKT